MKKFSWLLILLAYAISIRSYAQNDEQIPENPIITPENADQIVELMMLGRGWVTDVAYSPDGKTVLVAGSVGIWVYDADDLDTPVRLLTGHTQRVNRVVYRPDGRTFASFSLDDTVRIWDAETQETINMLEPIDVDDDYLTAIAYSPDNRMIAIATADGFSGKGIVQIWNAETEEVLYTLEGHVTNIESLSFSLNGHKLASSGCDHTIRIWDIETGVTLQILEAGEKLERPLVECNPVYDVIFNSDGSHLVSASDDKMVRIWDVETGEILQELVGHTNGVKQVVYSPNGQNIASVSWDNTMRIWDAETGEAIRIIENENIANILTYSPDGRIIATGTEFWDAETGELTYTLHGHEEVGNSLAYSPDGNILASGAGSKIFIWDAKTGLLLKQFEGSKDIQVLVFSPDGTMLVSGDWSDRTTRVWDINTGEILQSIDIPGGDLAFSPDGQTLAIGRIDFVYLFNVETWTNRAIKVPDSYRGGVSSIDFSPNGRFITIAVVDVIPIDLQIWDVEIFETVQTLHVSGNYPIENVTYSPDGLMIAGADFDGTIYIWDTESGQMLYTLKSISTSNAIAYSPDGRMIISGTDDGTIEIWDIEVRDMVNILYGHTNGLRTVSFNPNGRFIASASADGTIRIWGVPIGE